MKDSSEDLLEMNIEVFIFDLLCDEPRRYRNL